MKSIIKFSFLFLLIGAPIFSSCKDEKKEEELAVLVDQYQKEREEARKTVDELENLYAKEKEYYYVKINVSKTPDDIKTIVLEAEKDNAIISKVKRKYYVLLDQLEHLAPEERVEFKNKLDAVTEATAIAAMMTKAEELSAKYIYLNDQLLKNGRFTKVDGAGIVPISEHKNKFTREELSLVVDVYARISDKKNEEKYGFFDPLYFPNLENAEVRKGTSKSEVDISFCKKLKSMIIDGISSIKIGNLPELKKFQSESEKLTTIDLSGCPMIKEFKVSQVLLLEEVKFSELAELEEILMFNCDNLKKQLDINRFTKLRKFAFFVYKQEGMKFQNPNLWDFSKMDLLEDFRIRGVGSKIEFLKFSSNATKLKRVSVQDSNVGVLDCSNMPNLNDLNLISCMVEKVLFPEIGSLEVFSLRNPVIATELDFSKQKNIKSIGINDDNNKIFTQFVGVEGLEGLLNATFSCPNLKLLDLSKSKNLKFVSIYRTTKLILPEGKESEEGFRIKYKD